MEDETVGRDNTITAGLNRLPPHLRNVEPEKLPPHLRKMAGLDQLPDHPTGKIQKHQIRKQGMPSPQEILEMMETEQRQDAEKGKELLVYTLAKTAKGLPSVEDIQRMVTADKLHDLKDTISAESDEIYQLLQEEKQLIIDTEREMIADLRERAEAAVGPVAAEVTATFKREEEYISFEMKKRFRTVESKIQEHASKVGMHIDTINENMKKKSDKNEKDIRSIVAAEKERLAAEERGAGGQDKEEVDDFANELWSIMDTLSEDEEPLPEPETGADRYVDPNAQKKKNVAAQNIFFAAWTQAKFGVMAMFGNEGTNTPLNSNYDDSSKFDSIGIMPPGYEAIGGGMGRPKGKERMRELTDEEEFAKFKEKFPEMTPEDFAKLKEDMEKPPPSDPMYPDDGQMAEDNREVGGSSSIPGILPDEEEYLNDPRYSNHETAEEVELDKLSKMRINAQKPIDPGALGALNAFKAAGTAAGAAARTAADEGGSLFLPDEDDFINMRKDADPAVPAEPSAEELAKMKAEMEQQTSQQPPLEHRPPPHTEPSRRGSMAEGGVKNIFFETYRVAKNNFGNSLKRPDKIFGLTDRKCVDDKNNVVPCPTGPGAVPDSPMLDSSKATLKIDLPEGHVSKGIMGGDAYEDPLVSTPSDPREAGAHSGDDTPQLPVGDGDVDWPWYVDEQGDYRRIHPITQVGVLFEMPSPSDFYKYYVQTNTPVLLKGGCKGMPATHKWTDEYLRAESGHATVRVETSPKNGAYGDMADGWAQHHGPLEEFIDEYTKDESSSYLSSMLPSDLAKDVHIPSMYPGSDETIAQVVLWHGKGGSNSLIHNDRFDNLYMIMSGKKAVTLFDPLDGTNVYEKIWGMYKVSPVNITNPDYKQHPLYKLTRPIQVTVEAGDILYIPTLWFHEVKTFGRTSAVTTWFDGMNLRKAVGMNNGGGMASNEILKRVWNRVARVGNQDAKLRQAVVSKEPRPMSTLMGCAKPIAGKCYFGED